MPSREGSSSPTPNPNRWDIGIPGSAAEHDTLDSRFTAPLTLRPSESQTPRPTNGAGLQDDGLDDFMDRRSQITPTPTPCPFLDDANYVQEDLKMEE